MALHISNIFQVYWPIRNQTQETVFFLPAGHHSSGYKNYDDSLQHPRSGLIGHIPGRGYLCHPRHCQSLQVVAAHVGALIRQQLAVEHRHRALNSSRHSLYSLLISHGDLRILRVLCGGMMSTWHFFSIWVEVAATVSSSAGGGSSCTGGGSSESSWLADTVHCPSFLVSTS